MKREFFAHFDIMKAQDKKNILDDIAKKTTDSYPWSRIEDFYGRLPIITQLLASHENCLKRTKCKDYARRKLMDWYHTDAPHNPSHSYQKFLCQRLRWMDKILQYENPDDTISPPLPNLSHFPKGAWVLRIQFTLKKPYISKDDTDFYIIDNPVKKEWVFKVPYVAPSQWKGALRAAMMRELVNKLVGGDTYENKFTEERLRLFRLFGNEKDGTAAFLNRSLAEHRGKDIQEIASKFEEELRQRGYRQGDIEGFQGRLHFYPTFFDRIGMEVINPHDRKTGVGTNPIYFECVPAGTSGVFQLLYVPLDRIGKDAPEAIEQEAKADLEAVARGVRAMLTQYGFGAKTSSGYGVVEEKVKIGGAPPERREEFEQIWHSIGLGQPQ